MNPPVYHSTLSSTANEYKNYIKPTLNSKKILIATLFYVVAALREHKEFKTSKYTTFQLFENKFKYTA